MGEALREAYHDLFNISDNPKESDKEAIEGKFKSFHNASDNSAKNMAATFFALLKIADVSGKTGKAASETATPQEAEQPQQTRSSPRERSASGPTFHYNIQVHLPASKDIEVYNAIFKSMREHFVDL